MSEAPLPEEQAAKGKSEQAITMNKVVSFHYRLAEVGVDGDRGDWREESHSGMPLAYLHGFHNVVVGLEKALEGKTVGDAIEITLNQMMHMDSAVQILRSEFLSNIYSFLAR